MSKNANAGNSRSENNTIRLLRILLAELLRNPVDSGDTQNLQHWKAYDILQKALRVIIQKTR